jgi:hypothetical protein
MHPVALAKRTKQSNQNMVAQVQALADLVGIPEVTEELAKIRPSIRQPAVTALKEREALVAVLDQIRERMANILAQQTQTPESEEKPDTRTSRRKRQEEDHDDQG